MSRNKKRKNSIAWRRMHGRRQRAAATQLRCLKVASHTFGLQTKQLVQRANEATAFLTLFDEQQKKAKPDEPPEAALILAYSCNSPSLWPRQDVGLI
jgi:hypothetical protein